MIERAVGLLYRALILAPFRLHRSLGHFRRGRLHNASRLDVAGCGYHRLRMVRRNCVLVGIYLANGWVKV